MLDGEIVCLDKRGKPQFRDLLFHRGEPCFFAFDLLMSDGKDLRMEKLADRKQELRRLMAKVAESRMRYAEHVDHHGTALFRCVCEMAHSCVRKPVQNEPYPFRPSFGSSPDKAS